MLKSRVQKFGGLKYENLKENIVKAIEKYQKIIIRTILEGAYNRKMGYSHKNKARKLRKMYQ